MSFERYLSLERTVVLASRTREEAIAELTACIAHVSAAAGPDMIMRYVTEREETLSTRLCPDIAIPHARTPGFPATLSVVGLSRAGIQWDTNDPTLVKVVILIVGDGNEHLTVLALIAERLNDPTVRQELVTTGSRTRAYSLLSGTTVSGRTRKRGGATRASSVQLLYKAAELARDLKVSAIVYHSAGGDAPAQRLIPPGFDFFLICSDRSLFPNLPANVTDVVQVPFKNMNRTSQTELVLIYLISQGLLKRNRKVISVLGDPDTGVLDTLMISDTARFRLFFAIGSNPRPFDLDHQVLARMLQITGELAAEGREGKPVGTLFVLGDSENVLQSCQQMVVNPFGGYRQENRNVLDPGLEATIKEFSKIDGAFIIRGDGVILTSGAFIKAANSQEPAQKGFGARHTAAANISAATDALAIALSESTRQVSVFKGGKRIMYF